MNRALVNAAVFNLKALSVMNRALVNAAVSNLKALLVPTVAQSLLFLVKTLTCMKGGVMDIMVTSLIIALRSKL